MSKEIDEHVLRLYQPKKLLGSGAYGHVWRAIDKRNGRQYALKKVFDAFSNATDAQRTYREITLLTHLDHPNIVRLNAVVKAQNNRDLYIIFEYVQADLHTLVGQGVLQDVHIRYVAWQLLKALGYLHSAQLLHRDLKPSNILINSECQIKLCDFGLARTLTCQQQQEMVLSQQVATRWYRSPQMLLGSRHYSYPTDVWSVGCIVGQLLIGQPLFPGQSTLDQLQKIVEFSGQPSRKSVQSLQSQVADSLLSQLSIKRRKASQFFKGKDAQLSKLVQRMLEFNPFQRITIKQAMKSQCFKQFAGQVQICDKFVVPQVDDNVRLTVQQYRKIIYQDIKRRYPEENMHVTNPKKLPSFIKAKSKSKQKCSKQHSRLQSVEKKQTLVKQTSYHNLKSKGEKSVNKLQQSEILNKLQQNGVVNKSQHSNLNKNQQNAGISKSQVRLEGAQTCLKRTGSRKQLIKKKISPSKVMFKK